MMEFIRKNAASWMMKIILGAIVVVFVFWGVGTFRSGRLDIVAKVNGEKILLEQFTKEYNRALEQYQRMFGGSIPDALLKSLNIKQQVLDNLINQEIIAQEAAKMGIRVSDQEVQDVILSMDVFKKNGVFDPGLYQAALRNARIVPADFENQVRQEIRIRKIQALLASGIHVTEDEVRQRYEYENQQINLAFVKLPSFECEDEVKVTDEALSAWYQDHKEEFRTQPQIRLRYLLFDRSRFEKAVEVTDQEIEQWYQEHKDEFHQQEQRRARHILIKVPEGADQAQVEAARKRAEEVLKSLKEGKKSFEALAKEYSDDPGTKDRGGDLGFFSRGTMVKPFEDAVFSMKKGDIKGPVRSRFGFHIIKLEEIRPERTRPLGEVKAQIEARLKRQKAEQLMWDAANKAYDTIIEMGSLETYAKAEGMELKETGLFSRANPDEVLGTDPQVLDAVFSLNSGELSSLLEVPRGIVVAEVLEKKVPYIPELKDVRKRAEAAFRRDEAVRLCRQKAQRLIELAGQKGLEAAAAEMGLKAEETGFFARSDTSAGGKLPPQVVEQARSLYKAKGKDLVKEPIQMGSTFFVVAYKADRPAPAEKFEAARGGLENRILAEKRQAVFLDWLKDARERSEIEVVRQL